MSGYTRQQTYIDGDVILAEHTNDEFDLLEEVFSTSLGHKHDGTTAEGPTIDILSDDDGDTKIELEVVADDDIIKFTNFGTASGRFLADGTFVIGDTVTPTLFGGAMEIWNGATLGGGLVISNFAPSVTFDDRSGTGTQGAYRIVSDGGQLLTTLDVGEDGTFEQEVFRVATEGVAVGNSGIGISPTFGNGKAIAFGDSDTGIRQDGDGELEFWTNAVERIHVTNTGDVGIGEDTPLGKVHIKTSDAGAITPNGNANEFILESSGNTGMTVYSGAANAGNIYFGDVDSDTIGRVTYEHSANRLDLYTNNTKQVSVDSSGNLGIGVDAPAFTVGTGIEVQRTSATATYRAERTGTGPSTIEVRANNGTGDVYTTGAYPLVFGTNNFERLRITSIGDIGIGTTTPASDFDFKGDVVIIGDVDATSTKLGSTPCKLAVAWSDVGRLWDVNADTELFISRDANVGLTLKTADTFTSFLNFADNTAEFVGRIAYSHTNDQMAFTTNGAGRMWLNSSGDLGVGESSPLGKLHIKVSDVGAIAPNANGDELILENSGNTGMTIYSSTTGSGNIYFGDVDNDARGRIAYEHSDDSMDLYTAGVSRIRLDSAGNMGLNIDAGNTFANGSAFAIGDNDTGIRQDGDGQLELWANNNEIIHINTTEVDNLRDVRISTTAPRIIWDETDVSQEWRMGSGGGNLLIIDQTAGVNVGVISNGAPVNSLYIQPDGDVLLSTRAKFEEVTIATDSVASITPPRSGGFMFMTYSGTGVFPQRNESIGIYYDVGTSRDIQSLGWTNVGSEVSLVVDTTLTGTTGTSGWMTIAANDGVLQIENRQGGASISLTFV